MKEGDSVRLLGTPYNGVIKSIVLDGENNPLYAIEMPQEAIDAGHEPIETVSEKLIAPCYALHDLHQELLNLTKLRNEVFAIHDPINRLFMPAGKVDGPTRADLDKAIAELEAKVPGFHLWFTPMERQYGLFPTG